jgi:hypothetical protein
MATGGAGSGPKGSLFNSGMASNPPVSGPKKRVIPKATANDDVDELDDLMGFGGQQ